MLLTLEGINEVKSIEIAIQNSDGKIEDITLSRGSSLFILGANGAGKSSLINQIAKDRKVLKDVIFISAHRQVWFEDHVIDMSNSEYSAALENLNNRVLYTTDSRWRITDHRANKLPIVRLKKSINRRNRDLAEVIDSGDLSKINDKNLIARSPKDIINELLKSSGIPISIYHDEEDNLTVHNSNYNPPKNYTIAELSDGEKNAISVAADVISALPGTVFIIDEPERHLHRSVASPLLSELISLRRDCFFIVSTHDISLASDMEDSKILLLRKCIYNEVGPFSWDMKIIDNPSLIDDDFREDILGAKESILFIEGVDTSMDLGLYKSIFPNVTLIPKTGCDDVVTSVVGIRTNDRLNWINVLGLIDNDNKTEEEVSSLQQKGIFSLKYHSIESIYYHPCMIKMFIKEHGVFMGIDDAVLLKIKDEVLKKFDNEEKKKDICTLAVNKKVRWMYSSLIPSSKDGFENKTIKINAGDIYKQELALCEKAIAEEDFQFLIERYSVRRTGVLQTISTLLNCSSRKFYEAKVTELVRTNLQAKNFVVDCLDGLYEQINNPS